MNGPPRLPPCPSPAHACRRSSIHGNILVGAPASFSSIHCSWPLSFLSQFWGALHCPLPQTPSPKTKRRRLYKSLDTPCDLGAMWNSALADDEIQLSATCGTFTQAKSIGWEAE